MRTYLVFLKCEIGKAYEVAPLLVDEIEESPEVHSVSGEYDGAVPFPHHVRRLYAQRPAVRDLLASIPRLLASGARPRA